MQNQIMQTPDDFCFLVEAIAPCSRNIPWGCSVNKTHCEHAHIRRVSMDQFYAIVTGEATAFFEMCMQLPRTIEKIVKQNKGTSKNPLKIRSKCSAGIEIATFATTLSKHR